MEISFVDLKEKEVINICDGKKLGHILDVTFDMTTGQVLGFVLPGEKHFLKRREDLFVDTSCIKKIGEDVLLVKLELENQIATKNSPNAQEKVVKKSPLLPYLKYKRTIKREK